MPQVCVHTFPVLAEMTFLKMVAILVVDTLNQSSSSRRYGSIAIGPLSFELSNLTSARQSISSSPPDQKIVRLIIEFNAFNKYSMVCYPVGMHYTTSTTIKSPSRTSCFFAAPASVAVMDKTEASRETCLSMHCSTGRSVII